MPGCNVPDQAGCTQSIHDRPLDFGQMESRTGIAQIPGKVRQHFQRTRIDMIDGGTQQDNMPHIVAVHDRVHQMVAHHACIDKGQAFIDAKNTYTAPGLHGMALDIAVVLGARNTTHFGDMRVPGTPDK